MSAEEVGKAFCAHWYQVRGNNPEQLSGLFKDQSMLTFEGEQLQGPAPIVGKLGKIGRAAYQSKTIDIQPSVDPNSIIIFVTGSVTIDANNPLNFAETFQLCSSGPGQYYVHNCIFRLNYG